MSRRMNYGPRFGSQVAGGKTTGINIGASIHPAARYASDTTRALWRAKADATINNKKNGVSLPNKAKKQPAVDPYYAAEARMKERVEHAIKILCFGIEELSSAPPPTHMYRQTTINQSAILQLMQSLCFQVKIRPPELHIERKAGASYSSKKRCMDCGAELIVGDYASTCNECRQNNHLHTISETRREWEREQERMKRAAKSLAKTIRKVERGIK